MTVMLWILAGAAYLLLAGFFILERMVRTGSTRRMTRESTDQGSTTWVSAVMGVAFVVIPLTPLLNWWGPGRLNNWVIGVIGVAVGVTGLVIRHQAFTTLGRFFTRTLQRVDEHRLVTDGIYRRVRHPGYLSDILIFIGAAMAMNNWITILLVVALFLPAYRYRIKVEETMLTGIFGTAYTNYQAHTKRLVPGIW